MYRFIIERGDKIVHLRVQKYSSPKKAGGNSNKQSINYQEDAKTNMI